MKRYITGLVVVAALISACEKKVDPVDTFGVKVEFRSNNPKQLTSDVTVNPKDSIYFNFTITSDEDMSFVEIQKNGVRVDTFRLDNQSDKKTFSFIKGYRADSAAGDYVYRVLGRDAKAVFLGDGGKSIRVTVAPDFYFWSYRIMQVPDTVEKKNKCYYSTSEGKVYSYSEGAANSAKIDFGYYYDTTSANRHTFYALTAVQPQLSFYDISSWTKNATIFKKMAASGTTAVNFNNLTSSGAINTLIKNNMTSGTANKVAGLSLTNTGTTSNSVIGFRTADGKYGCILVRYISQNSAAKETSIEVDVKVQK
jgi:hypothetical protein